MTTREAMIINTATKNPILDLDPIDIEVTVDGFAVGVDAALMDLWDTLNDDEAVSDETCLHASLVWSDDLTRVRFVCSGCDDVAYAEDGVVEDLLDGHSELVCAECSH